MDRELRDKGWEVLRIWDFEIRKDLASAVERVVKALDRSERL